MAERPLSDQFLLRLKAATRDLVSLCGGVERAAQVASLSKSAMSRFQVVDAPDVIDLPTALKLERECGHPAVTSVMAEMHGRRLSDEVAGASAQSVLEHHAEVMRRTAETATKVALAFADQVVTPAEAVQIDRTLAELETAIRAMRGSCAGVIAQGATPAAAPLSSLRAVL